MGFRARQTMQRAYAEPLWQECRPSLERRRMCGFVAHNPPMFRSSRLPSLAFMAIALIPANGWAYLDIEDKGPTLSVGSYRMRVTNAGIIGNAFFGSGLSFDPSFEFPANSGFEHLNSASLWIGARLPSGEVRVSGAPHLEWRPTMDAADSVRAAYREDLGTRRLHDDDGDSRMDEEWLDGRDDDGDGRIDEDLALPSDQMIAASYNDFERAAITMITPGGEQHRPLGLKIRQTALAWRVPDLSGVAAFEFQITKVGTEPLRDVYVGILADLDIRHVSDRAGHLDDVIVNSDIGFSMPEGYTSITAGRQHFYRNCLSSIFASYIGIGDRHLRDKAVTIVPVSHTTDPLAWMPSGAEYATSPRIASFRSIPLLARGLVARGVVPALDSERYAAMQGGYPSAPSLSGGDYSVLLSCGPFQLLYPDQRISFSVAFVAAAGMDSLRSAVRKALEAHHGFVANLVPDSLPDSQADQYRTGFSGQFGHEACVEAPPGVSFLDDPHCSDRFPAELGLPVEEQLYTHGRCIWTNADCNICTGTHGNETRVRWSDLPTALPPPRQLVVPGDRVVRVLWDNFPELHLTSAPEHRSRLVEYRLYKLADWRDRTALLPPPDNWALLGVYVIDPADTLLGQRPLALITDTSVVAERIQAGRTLFPPGRYFVNDPEVHNGFDYVYKVTSVVEHELIGRDRNRRVLRVETPLDVSLSDVIRPRLEASSARQPVWVVPNPYRGSAGWDRLPVPGDPLPRHVDFMGVPRARATIKIWTVAGDFVAQIDHDGSGGSGQVSWDLVSRNGQEVESGIYLFTVDSPLGRSSGKFVVIR